MLEQLSQSAFIFERGNIWCEKSCVFVLDDTKFPLHPWFHTKMNHGTMCLLNLRECKLEKVSTASFCCTNQTV